MSWKAIGIAAGGVAVIGTVAMVLWRPWDPTAAADLQPDPHVATTQEVTAYLASEQFGVLPSEQRVAYMERLREARGTQGGRGGPGRGFGPGRGAELTDQQREQLRKNLEPVREQRQQEMARRMAEQAKTYCELPAAERTAYLDQLIDEMQQRRRQWEAAAAARRDSADRLPRAQEGAKDAKDATSGKDERRRGFSPERLKERIESSDPVERAQHAEFRKAMMKRMEERGIQPGRGRGGGPR